MNLPRNVVYEAPIAKTMGEAIDAIVALHERLYPGSEVYKAEVSESETQDNMWLVEVRSAHFSIPCRYHARRS